MGRLNAIRCHVHAVRCLARVGIERPLQKLQPTSTSKSPSLYLAPMIRIASLLAGFLLLLSVAYWWQLEPIASDVRSGSEKAFKKPAVTNEGTASKTTIIFAELLFHKMHSVPVKTQLKNKT